MDDKIVKLALLHLPGWGSVSAKRLISENQIDSLFDPDSVLDAIESLSKKHKRIKVPEISDIRSAFSTANLILDKCSNLNIQLITEADANYPTRFATLETNPLVLFAKGNTNTLNDRNIVALIGTRSADPWILKSMRRLGYRCAENNIIVLSGLALGCDTEAHQGCVDAAGKTIAVLGNGLDEVYPKQNKELSNAILENDGCLLSEYPPGTPVNKFQLVNRDKLQAILSDSIIVGQTSKDGGSMHAANYAMDKLSKQVAVLSGEICKGEPFSGNIELIQRRAFVLKNIEDFQDFVGISKKKIAAVLFDLDQTLIDSSRLEEFRKVRDWSSALRNLHLVDPVNGVSDCLSDLKKRGLKTGLITSSPKHYANAICKKFGWDFDVVVAYHDTNNHKPHPEPLITAANKLNANKDLCVYVGDNDIDRQAAITAQMDFIHLNANDFSCDLGNYLKIVTSSNYK